MKYFKHITVIYICFLFQSVYAQKVVSYENERVFDTLATNTILNRLFDNPEIDFQGMAIWTPNYYEREAFNVSYDGKCHTKIDTMMYFKDHSKRNCAVAILATYNFRINDDSTKIDIGDCHFCGAIIGIALFYQTDTGKWVLYKYVKRFTSGGYFGGYDKKFKANFFLKEFGNQWTCLGHREGIGGNGGYMTGWEGFYAIEQYRISGYPETILRDVFAYNYYDSNLDSFDEKKEETKSSFTLLITEDYYDICLRTTGKHKKSTKYYSYSADSNDYVEVKE